MKNQLNTTPPNIMVVDDSPQNLRLLEKMFRENGYYVIPVPNGEMALKIAAKNPPDIILLDINMPDMDGYEVCEHLKQMENAKDIPVLFVSAFDDTGAKLKAFELGGHDYVTKPFQLDEVRARVETHLHLRLLQEQVEQYNHLLEDRVKEQVKEISDSQLATILAMAKLAESRDDDTGQHIERTQIFCKILAEALMETDAYKDQIDPTYIQNIFHSAPLHDIGKVSISDAILLKPGKLTSEEFEIMKTHAAMGAETLKTVYKKYPKNTFIKMGIEIARSHHEKWDGSGYPDGLKEGEIPLAAGIMAVADVYDALRSKRVYKDAFPHDKCRAIIVEGTGKHFNPRIVDAFLNLENTFKEIRDRMDN